MSYPTSTKCPVELSSALIQRPSVTPEDAGCQDLIAKRLEQIGFRCEHLRFGEVDNLWARRGTQAPLFVFAGHTDVVPTGHSDSWTHPPFGGEIHDGFIHGRGAADMKSSIAAMLVAVERFIEQYPQHQGSIAFLITSDEEGPAKNGTIKVVETCIARGEKIDWCLVGEPSSTKKVGDIIKNGRRGSLNGELVIQGKQGHVAYSHLANNPIHLALPALSELCATHWDNGNDYFPPTTFQISNINSGTGATNVIPNTLHCLFNFRFSTESSKQSLSRRCESILKKYPFDFQLTWRLSGNPFITPIGELTRAAQRAVKKHTQLDAALSTSGGTSDGRFIAPTGAQVIELGPCNATIHQINECVRVKDVQVLGDIYGDILRQLLA